ncbi:MAG: transposase [Planctomycetaceae bacterium]|nr:transposase [Planctomycetaceae bacterium]
MLYAKSAQKRDARWTKKNNASYFGYKNHVNANVRYKFIRDDCVTDASVHDSNEFLDFFPARSEEDQWKPCTAEDFT